jgi:drug/metabolite transporter (DMT)-like permease
MLPLLPALALAFNAMVWGLSWWPFRYMQAQGLHPLWATVFIFTVATVAVTYWRPQAVREVLCTPALWVLMLAAGTTNAAFNWAVTIGDVVRVVLLFYLMPLWSVLFARWLLNERLTAGAAARVALALAGAVVVLWPASNSAGGWWLNLPLPRNLPEALGVIGGMSFALNNVMLRREAQRSEAARGWAMFAGGIVVAGVLAVVLSAQGLIPAMSTRDFGLWVWPALGLSVFFLASNMALQYGAARLPANVTSVVMLSEVVFASVSAALLGAGELTPAAVAGGSLIVLAGLLAIRRPAASAATSPSPSA